MSNGQCIPLEAPDRYSFLKMMGIAKKMKLHKYQYVRIPIGGTQ